MDPVPAGVLVSRISAARTGVEPEPSAARVPAGDDRHRIRQRRGPDVSVVRGRCPNGRIASRRYDLQGAERHSRSLAGSPAALARALSRECRRRGHHPRDAAAGGHRGVAGMVGGAGLPRLVAGGRRRALRLLVRKGSARPGVRRRLCRRDCLCTHLPRPARARRARPGLDIRVSRAVAPRLCLRPAGSADAGERHRGMADPRRGRLRLQHVAALRGRLDRRCRRPALPERTAPPSCRGGRPVVPRYRSVARRCRPAAGRCRPLPRCRPAAGRTHGSACRERRRGSAAEPTGHGDPRGRRDPDRGAVWRADDRSLPPVAAWRATSPAGASTSRCALCCAPWQSNQAHRGPSSRLPRPTQPLRQTLP